MTSRDVYVCGEATIPEATDVLIVGAGPTGLMLANQLARAGIRPLLIDRHAAPSVETKALGVQARTLEIYAHLGVADRALELGKRGTGASLWVRGRHAARVPLGDIGRALSPYPFLLILGQDDNERLLGDALRTHGVAVCWKTELVGLVQHPGAVSATLRQADGRTTVVQAAWVAGCDGAHSAVRSLNGIGFPGAPYEHVFFVADTEVTGPMTPGELNVYLWPDGFHLLFPMRGTDHWRIVGIVPAGLRNATALRFEDVVPSIRKEAGALAFRACNWFSSYRIHHRRAERFRDNRCFLLGDAAHIHSPAGAQGMNTGLQDAYNLGWKLALVASGRADAALLGTYPLEREPVAERLLQSTDRFFSLIASDNWLSGLFRTRVAARLVAFAMRFHGARQLAFRAISQIGIHYRRSPLSVALQALPNEAPRAGDRFPWICIRLSAGGGVQDLYAVLDDTCFTLVAFGESLAADVGPRPGLLEVLRVPGISLNDDALRGVHIPVPSFYLLRPDGHVGMAGTGVDAAALRRYFDERIHLQG